MTQTQYKIYTYAREIINAVMNDLYINHDFSTKEILWKTTRVELELVVFEIHERIKDILEKEVTRPQLNGACKEVVTFKLKNDSIWEATVQGSGAESYYFARMLFTALVKMTSGMADVESATLNIIEQYATKAAIKAQINSMGFVAKASYKNGKYEITVPANGLQLTFAHNNPDMLCRSIGMQLRGHLKSTP